MIELARQIDVLRGRVQQVEKENEFLREQLRLLTAQLYGRKSERLPQAESPQLMLFDETAVEPEPTEAAEESIEIAAHRRAKSGRKPLPENLPRVEIVHDVTEEEKRCGCGAEKAGSARKLRFDIMTN
jgi:transposase